MQIDEADAAGAGEGTEFLARLGFELDARWTLVISENPNHE
jgi:hypothetical protein